MNSTYIVYDKSQHLDRVYYVPGAVLGTLYLFIWIYWILPQLCAADTVIVPML